MVDQLNINWLLPDQLGGMPMPGTVNALEQDLTALQKAGVTMLISLTAEWEPPVEEMAAFGIGSVHCPITDFAPPRKDQAAEVCASIAMGLAQGERILLHCKAGKGRTGTLLACYLISQGDSAALAITKCRGIYDQWIETEGQIAFLHKFSLKNAVI